MKRRFKDLFEFIRNGLTVTQSDSGGAPISRIETISAGVIDPQRVGFANLDPIENKGWLLQDGDILFSHINSVTHIGKCAVYEGYPQHLIHGMNLLCLRPDKTQTTSAFVKYLIRSDEFRNSLRRYVKKAVNQASVSIASLSDIEVQVPPLEEQRRIAAILDQADALRDKRRQALALVEQLTQSVFLEMFGDPVTNPKFASEPLLELCDAKSGGTPSRGEDSYWDGSVPWFSPKDLKSDVVADSEEHLSTTGLRGAKLKLFPPGTVVIVVRGMILAHTFPVCQLGQAGTINQDVKALTPDERALPIFVAAALRASAGLVLSLVSTAGHGTKKLDAFGLSQIKIPLPPLELQQEFARRVEAIEKLKAAHQQSLKEMDALFASLQHRAFRGEL